MKLEQFFTPYTKINSKWNKDLNVRQETINLQRKTKAEHSDINHNKTFYDPPCRVIEINTKIKKKRDLIKPNFCVAKKNINKMKRKPLKWEKIIANEANGKGLIFKI